MCRRGNTHPPPCPLPRAASFPAPGWSLPERIEEGWKAREGSCHAGTGKEKQPRAHLAGQEVLKRSDPAHRKAKGGEEVDLEGGERWDWGTAREQGRHATQLQKAGQAHASRHQWCWKWESCPILWDNTRSETYVGQTL